MANEHPHYTKGSMCSGSGLNVAQTLAFLAACTMPRPQLASKVASAGPGAPLAKL